MNFPKSGDAYTRLRIVELDYTASLIKHVFDEGNAMFRAMIE